MECIASSSEEAVVRCVHIYVIRIRLCLQALRYVTEYVFQYKNNPLLLLQQLVLKNFISSVVLVVLVILYCFLYI